MTKFEKNSTTPVVAAKSYLMSRGPNPLQDRVVARVDGVVPVNTKNPITSSQSPVLKGKIAVLKQYRHVKTTN